MLNALDLSKVVMRRDTNAGPNGSREKEELESCEDGNFVTKTLRSKEINS